MLLDIVIVARDDGYEPGYARRMQLCLASISSTFKGSSSRLILVNYNPPIGSEPIDRFIPKGMTAEVVTVSPEMHQDILDRHEKAGAQIWRASSQVRWSDVRPRIGYLWNYGCNFGLEKASADYVCFMNTDTIVPAPVASVLDMLYPGRIIHAPVRYGTQDGAEADFKGVLSGHIPEEWAYRNEDAWGTGIGSFTCIRRNHAAEFGGLLPYLMPRSKRTDTMLSYFASAYGYETYIPDFDVIDLDHPKVKPFSWTNYTVNTFSFSGMSSRLTEWLHANRTGMVTRPASMRIRAKRGWADKLSSSLACVR